MPDMLLTPGQDNRPPQSFNVNLLAEAIESPKVCGGETFPGMNIQGSVNLYSHGTMSIQLININESFVFKNGPFFIMRNSNAGSRTFLFGLYSLNGSTLSLANSASITTAPGAALTTLAISVAYTNRSTNISNSAYTVTPGPWWAAVNVLSGGNSSFSVFGNTSLISAALPAGIIPIYGYYATSTTGMPGSIASTDVVNGNAGAARQPYVLIA